MAKRKFRKSGAVGVGRVHPVATDKMPLPPAGKVARYILTSAQNNTMIHDRVWASLKTLARHYEAQIMVSTFTYDHSSIGSKSAKRGTEQRREEYWWDERVEGHVYDRSIEIAPGLIFCGELNILPTAKNPIGGFEAYTGRASSILPHAKFQVTCVPSPKFKGTKFVYTTGTVTLRNYIQKKAGQVAQFHHGYGAALVEVDSEGTWFVRQLNADSDGVIHDMDLVASGDELTTGNRVEAVVWGDIHVRQMEDWMKVTMSEVMDTLRPRTQAMHDLLDFRSKNHHERDDPWKTFKKFVENGSNVEEEVREAAKFLSEMSHEDCNTLVVCSNHDQALERWLREADWKKDPENALFYLRMNLLALEAIEAKRNDFYAVEWAFRLAGIISLSDVRFLRRDEEHTLCPKAGGGIEIGMHGDKGANGAKGDLRAFARTGRKCIVGDRHTAGLYEGAMQVGVMGSLDHGYNVGMSSWSHTFAIVYPNGKRTLATVYDKKWRAQ